MIYFKKYVIEVLTNRGILWYNRSRDYNMNYNYNKNNHCIECNKLISNYAIRCHSCAGKISGKASKPNRKSSLFSNSHKLNISKSVKNFYKKTGRKSSNYKTGETKDSIGYVLIFKPNHPFAYKNGYVRKSRLVMEKKLGRYLNSNEVIHHINEIKDDNRIESLRLFKSQQAHTLYHLSKNKAK